MPRRRLGVVLLVPPPVGHEVDGLRRALADPALGQVAPHLTLVPPVNVREDDLPSVLRLLADAAASAGPLTLDLGPLATFLPVNPVLYLSVHGPGLEGVHRLRGQVAAGPVARSVTHEFVPHVTVAAEIAEDRIPEALHLLGGYRHAITVVEHLHLLEEQRDDEGRRVWRPIAGWVLGGGSVVGRGGFVLVL